MYRAFAALAVAGSVFLAAPAAAQESAPNDPDAQARAHFGEGRAAFEAGEYESALAHFEEAYELSGRPGLLYNIASTHDRLRHNREALESFERFLEAEPDSPLVRQVEQRIAILRRDLAVQASLVAAANENRQAPVPAPVEASDNRIVKKWWFWTILGAVVAGTAVGVGVGLSRSEVPAPQTFDSNTFVIEL